MLYIKSQIECLKRETILAIIAYCLQGSLHDVANCGDLLRLPDSVHAVKGLFLEHGVPLGLHKENVVCSR